MNIYEVEIEILETHAIHAESEAQAEALAQKKCAWNRGHISEDHRVPTQIVSVAAEEREQEWKTTCDGQPGQVRRQEPPEVSP